MLLIVLGVVVYTAASTNVCLSSLFPVVAFLRTLIDASIFSSCFLVRNPIFLLHCSGGLYGVSSFDGKSDGKVDDLLILSYSVSLLSFSF